MRRAWAIKLAGNTGIHARIVSPFVEPNRVRGVNCGVRFREADVGHLLLILDFDAKGRLIGSKYSTPRAAAAHRGHKRYMSEQIQVLVVDDHPPVAQGLEFVLTRQGFRMIGSAGSADEGARMIRARVPDVALVDIDLGDGSGIDLANRAAHRHGRLPLPR